MHPIRQPLRSSRALLALIALAFATLGSAADPPALAPSVYIKATNTGAEDGFGYGLALQGDTLAVGAPAEDSLATGIDGDQGDNAGTNTGAVNVYVRSGGGWVPQAYLKASNTGDLDGFGFSLALSGNTLAVGAPMEASGAVGVDGDQGNDGAPASGAVYVFERDAGGTWTQQAYLKASNTGPTDLFGFALALDGDTLVVGAPGEDSLATGVNGHQGNDFATESGAAYVFVRDASGNWSQQAYLKASNTFPGANFGAAVAASGDALLVGAPQESSAGEDAGAAYVFVRSGGIWLQQAFLQADDAAAFDRFGEAVALHGDTALVGAPQYAIPGTPDVPGIEADAGAAYLFERSGTGWQQRARIEAPNASLDDGFGSAVALGDGLALIGAPREDASATGLDGDPSGPPWSAASGAAYAFTREADGAWTSAVYLKASNTGAEDQFGTRVALHDDALAVSAPGEDSSATGIGGDQHFDAAWSSGATYLFERLAPELFRHGFE